MEKNLFVLKHNFMHLAENYYNKLSKKTYENLTLTEVHCLASIGNSDKPNVTQTSLSMKMTKGAITKITSRLIKKKFLTKYNIEGNKKEVHFKLTESGLIIFKINEERQKEIEDAEKDFYKKFDEKDLDVIVDFFQKYNAFIEEKIETIK